jgi:hypothetical protein
MDFKNLTVDQEAILRSILSGCRYFNFAMKNGISDSVYADRGKEMAVDFTRLEQLEAAKAAKETKHV